MLSVNNLSFTIDNKQILQQLSLQFLPGKFNVILGPNGSGKSTLLKIISGGLHHYNGDVIYNSAGLKTLHNASLAKVRAVMGQQPELSFPLTVSEVVMMGRYPHFDLQPAKNDRDICNEVMVNLNLLAFAERNYLTLSGGEKQRVQFARVLAQIWQLPAVGNRYLFLDEPLNSLDINYQQEFLQTATTFAKNNTVLIAVLHDINLATQYADQLFFLKEGQLVASGTTEEILTAELIKKVFGVNVAVIVNPISGKPLVVFLNQ